MAEKYKTYRGANRYIEEMFPTQVEQKEREEK